MRSILKISEQIKQYDSEGMFNTLKKFPNQIKEAIEISEYSPGFKKQIHSKKIAIVGMGGSAIAGDLLRSYLCSYLQLDFEIEVIRGYNLPGYISDDTPIIASSYSGTTEETISSLMQAISQKMNILCITTGGKLEEIANKNNLPIIRIPKGYQPRCAVAYSFFPILITIMKSGIIPEDKIHLIEREIFDTIELLENKSNEYSEFSKNNLALKLSNELNGSIPIIYSSYELLSSVSTRWARQIQENAKHLAYTGILPEMNHNEINSFDNPPETIKNISIILLTDIEDHHRIKIRFDALQKLLGKKVKVIKSFEGTGDGFMPRMFDLLYLGDWFSYYLAILNNTDPTPIPIITKLKTILSKEQI